MDDDILKLLESEEKPFERVKEVPNDKKVNLWDKEDIKPVKIDPSSFKRERELFGITYFTGDSSLPEEIESKLKEIANTLAHKGYIFRSGADGKNELNNSILKLEGINYEHFNPWKKFNLDVKNVKLQSPTEKAYGIAHNSHRAFYKVPSSVRAILSKEVHLMLGENCDEPIKMLIVYTKCGSEGLKFKMDYKLTGGVAFLLKIAEDSNIPVFNLKNDDAIKRLVEFMKPKETND
jgi:hypothetical protein